MTLSFNDIEGRLNQQQKEVVFDMSRRLLCLAGAGTGKTFTLIAKLIYLTQVNGIDSDKILALTFTRAAAGEMLSRYNKYTDKLKTPFIGTFHSFCYNLIRQDHDICELLGYDKVPDICEPTQEARIFEEARKTLKVNLPKKANSISYQPKPKEKFDYKVLHKYVNLKLKSKNLITFDQLSQSVCALFESNNPKVYKYLKQYEYIFVDEFQDTDKYQWNFIKSFTNSNIFIVGDVRQAIYQFRGGDSSIIKSLLYDENWNVKHLEYNYRSTYEICEYANYWSRLYDDGLDLLELVSDRHGLSIERKKKYSFVDSLLCEDYENKSIAILTYSNDLVSKLRDRVMEINNFPYSLANYEIEYYKLVKAALDDDFRQNLLNQVSCYVTNNRSINGINEIIDEIQSSPNIDEFETLYHLDKLHELPNSTLEFQSSNVYIGTIHSVKGLEFDTVYVCGINSNSFQIEKNEQMRNIYYVAITRAISKLVLVYDY